jgi:hypothetical protein
VPRYCCASCRQTAYLKRRITPMGLLAEDIATAKVRAIIRTEIWKALDELGFRPPPIPPPRLRRAKPTQLQIVGEAPRDKAGEPMKGR